ncbi:MAG: CPBP family intramembrane metalloprotease [Candidatus Bathyarchaeota archaeon]|nr:CPBP family intramembrane metalloprotease [Candidatus Bathyarchaeota archaeon]
MGSLQWNNIPIPGDVRLIYKFAVPFVSLILALYMRKSSRFKGYWQVFFAYFVGGAAFLLQLLVFRLLSYPINVETIALEKALFALLTIVPIVTLTRFSGGDLGSIYLKRGKLGTGLLAGVALFALFAVASPMLATSMFGAQNVGSLVIGWAPWILVFVLSSGLLEESMYRGLFLKKYEALLGPRAANFLQALVFCSIHLSVAYTPEPYAFVALTFFLGLAWGWVAQRTDSLLASVLFHAGTDIPIILSIFLAL